MAFDQASLDAFWARSASFDETTDSEHTFSLTDELIKTQYVLPNQRQQPILQFPRAKKIINSYSENMFESPRQYALNASSDIKNSPARSDTSDDMMSVDSPINNCRFNNVDNNNKISPRNSFTKTKNSVMSKNSESPITSYFSRISERNSISLSHHSSDIIILTSDEEEEEEDNLLAKTVLSEPQSNTRKSVVFSTQTKVKTSSIKKSIKTTKTMLSTKVSRRTSVTKSYRKKGSASNTPIHDHDPNSIKYYLTASSPSNTMNINSKDLHSSKQSTPPKRPNTLQDATKLRSNITPSPKKTTLPTINIKKQQRFVVNKSSSMFVSSFRAKNDISPGTQKILEATESFGISGITMMKESSFIENVSYNS
ncbi:5051_t:CDS:2 [Ambispora gerdemannii]|uniref:5051_t:CDS:1 n=1 Tax=Ambispora gerdemannii TaxID=144530 RepID=A0A9N8WCL4_9GLOM|nr:5051_t:CDS:2 [Ambispora gerdemannii]